ncbi:CDP-glycerol glycerophosphotransferase family protein [Thalassotalea aquiviva]|uniref:CDP-glycerol glycerophosphotransferase family protein n=1 Tax=Thalassotalea aquiviva TaxID=3242415 RepID=UPI00352BA572
MNMQQPKINKYLFYVTLSYSFNVLRPIEQVLKQRGHQVAWFIPQHSEAAAFSETTDRLFRTIAEVKAYQADAVLVPGNYIPDFFPGIKVQVFHGFDSGKKNKFNIRGFFDLYCTQGPNITNAFNNINDGTCEVVETGWSKLDPLFTLHADTDKYQSASPTILYAPTFSPKLTSTYALLPHIESLAKKHPWQWLIKLHPKAKTDEIAMFKALAQRQQNVRFIETSNVIPLLQAADVLVSDTSSILAEFALQAKPVVALNNRRPEDWMINFSSPEHLEEKIEYALSNDPKLLSLIDQHCSSIHPYKDGQSSKRVVEAIDDLISRGTAHLKAKPWNIIRKLKMRKKFKYYHWR